MRIETIETIVMETNLPNPARAQCDASCARKLYVARDVKFRVLYVFARDMRARVWSGGEEVGTWTIPARREPVFVCERGGEVYVLTKDGRPYAHPHVFSDGRLCFGDNPPSTERVNILSALLNVNMNSAVWRPRNIRHRARRQQ